MTGNAQIKRLLDAGMHFTEMTQEQAEKLVKEFVKNGDAFQRVTVETGWSDDEHIEIRQGLKQGKEIGIGLFIGHDKLNFSGVFPLLKCAIKFWRFRAAEIVKFLFATLTGYALPHLFFWI